MVVSPDAQPIWRIEKLSMDELDEVSAQRDRLLPRPSRFDAAEVIQVQLARVNNALGCAQSASQVCDSF